jgi:hypothetical protein
MADSKTTFLQNSHMLSVFKRNVSFLFNHSKIQKKKYNLSMGNLGNQHMNQVKSVMILRSGKAIEKHILKPREKNMINQSLRIRKGLNLNIAKKRPIPHQYFHFLMS